MRSHVDAGIGGRGVLRTSPETVRYWRNAGKGPRSFKPAKRVLYAVEDVEASIAEARGERAFV
jgi:hypothetical protein